MKCKFFGVLKYKDNWANIDSEKATFEVPDGVEPFDYFQAMFATSTYLVTYIEVKEGAK